MKKYMVILWLCWWWMGQCLCHGSHLHLSLPSSGPKDSGQWLPSTNYSLMIREPARNSFQPAPGITENTHYNKENTPSSILPVTESEKVHTEVFKKNSSEQVNPLYKPATYTNNSTGRVNTVSKPPTHTNNSTGRMNPSPRPPTSTSNSTEQVNPSKPSTHTDKDDHKNHASKNTSTTDTTTDKGGRQNLQEDLHFKDETLTHSHNPVYMNDGLPATESFNNGGGREGHGRVTTALRDLCSFCLCDTTKENVFCKHDHVDHNNIHSLTLNQQVIPPSAQTLHISGFEKVVVKRNTFSMPELRLRNIHFEDIASLELSPESLHFSYKADENMEVALIFTNCKIPEMPQKTFTQMIRSEDPRMDIKLERTRFMSLRIEGCNIAAIRSYALFNARLLYFHMNRTKISIMEENSVHLDSFDEWIIERSELPNMIQKSICLRAQSIVVFSRNTFLGIGNRSLNIISYNQVLFEFNTVLHLGSEAMLGIQPHTDSRGANIVFLNNTIVKADERSLLIDQRYLIHERKITDNNFNIPCDCHVMTAFGNLLGIAKLNDYQELRVFKSVSQKSLCQAVGKVKSYIRVQAHMTENCTLPIIPIMAGIAVGVVILILVVVCVVCNRRVQRARDEANYLGECCYSQSFSTLHSNPQLPTSPTSGPPGQPWDPTYPLQPWVVAVPEVKTYKETELNVSYENIEPMNVSIRESFPLEPGQILDLQRRNQMRSSCPFN